MQSSKWSVMLKNERMGKFPINFWWNYSVWSSTFSGKLEIEAILKTPLLKMAKFIFPVLIPNPYDYFQQVSDNNLPGGVFVGMLI